LIASKESVWECPDRPQVPGTPKSWVVVLSNSSQQVTTRHSELTNTGELGFWVPIANSSNFHPKSPFLITFDPNSTSKFVY